MKWNNKFSLIIGGMCIGILPLSIKEGEFMWMIFFIIAGIVNLYYGCIER